MRKVKKLARLIIDIESASGALESVNKQLEDAKGRKAYEDVLKTFETSSSREVIPMWQADNSAHYYGGYTLVSEDAILEQTPKCSQYVVHTYIELLKRRENLVDDLIQLKGERRRLAK